MKNELRKMGVDELKLKNIVTRGLESLFLYLKRTELFLWNGLTLVHTPIQEVAIMHLNVGAASHKIEEEEVVPQKPSEATMGKPYFLSLCILVK